MAGKYLSLLVHFTWSTAGREPWIETEMRDDLYSYIGGIMKNKNAKLIAAVECLITFICTLQCPQRSALCEPSKRN